MIERKHAGGRAKGSFAIIAIMRTSRSVVVEQRFRTREAAIQVADMWNRALPLDDPVIQYCVRPAGRGKV
jgi:hypothetical protein